MAVDLITEHFHVKTFLILRLLKSDDPIFTQTYGGSHQLVPPYAYIMQLFK